MSIERFNEVKTLLKNRIETSNVIVIEGSKLMDFLNVLSYHYCLIEGQISNAYNNQFIDSVNNETDLVSICQMVGYVRRSKVPNSVYLGTVSTARKDAYTGAKGGVTYTFRALTTGSHLYYEGAFSTWTFTANASNSQRGKLANSQNLFVVPNSLIVTLNTNTVLKPCEEVKHFFDSNYYYVVENSDGTYSIQVFADGAINVEGFTVGSSNSHSIKQFNKGGTILSATSLSGGYQEKETISEVVKKFPSVLMNNNRCISISDYNTVGERLYPQEKLFFYEENAEGIVYFSNKAEDSLTSSQYNQIIDVFKSYYMIPGIDLKYKRLIPKVWVISIECLINDSNIQGLVTQSINDYFSTATTGLSLFKLMQTMYDLYSPSLVDIKINSSYIKVPIRNERVVDLQDKRGIIKVRPYMDHNLKDNKIYFKSSYSGEIHISNILSPITFREGDYVDYQYTITFTNAEG